jgi:hypothetical protein
MKLLITLCPPASCQLGVTTELYKTERNYNGFIKVSEEKMKSVMFPLTCVGGYLYKDRKWRTYKLSSPSHVPKKK